MMPSLPNPNQIFSSVKVCITLPMQPLKLVKEGSVIDHSGSCSWHVIIWFKTELEVC